MPQAADTALARGLPFDQYQFVAVHFGTADADVRISHALTPERAEHVVYIPVMKSHECTIYDRRQEPESPAWTRASVVLRSTNAPVDVWLLLAVVRLTP